MSTHTPNAPRRVLGDLSVNAPITTTSPTKKGPATSPSPSKERLFVRSTSENTLVPSEGAPMPLLPPADVGSKKRSFDTVDVAGFSTSPERQNDGNAVVEKQLDESLQEHGESHDICNADSQQQKSNETLSADIVPESPRSPFGFSFSQDVAIESQSTVFTEPENTEAERGGRAEDIEPAHSRVFNPDEARRQAETLRMRLRIAMYKIKTNQTDLPLSRLQIRSTNNRSSSTAREAPRTTSRISTLSASSPTPAPILARQASAGMYHGQSKLRDGTTWEPASPTDSVSTCSSDIHIDIEALRRKRMRRENEATVKTSEQGAGLQGKAADGLISLMSMSQG